MMVVRVLMELAVEAMAKRAMVTSQRSMPSALAGAGAGDCAESGG